MSGARRPRSGAPRRPRDAAGAGSDEGGLAAISARLSAGVDRLRFAPPVTHTLNPLAYARRPHEAYLACWGGAPKEILLLGMNPGPFGMAQTGVPFGDVARVRDFLGVEGPVEAPRHPHPRRPIEGFACTRAEVSGSRFWGWVEARFGAPERFFERFFVANYCPLAFLEESGRNLTPDKLSASERAALFAPCDDALRETVTHLGVRTVIGVGSFAMQRAAQALAGADVRVGTILHPSPASPLANRGWAEAAEGQLAALGVALP